MDDCESDLLHCFCQLGMASSPALTARIEWGSQANGIRIQPGVKSDLGLKYKVNKSTGAAWYCIPGGPESWIFRFSITRLNDLQISPACQTNWTNGRAWWELLDQSEARKVAGFQQGQTFWAGLSAQGDSASLILARLTEELLKYIRIVLPQTLQITWLIAF